MKHVVGLGEILWDCLPEGKKLGGAPANFAYHASQAGLIGIAVSAIGRDALGDEIRQVLEGVPSLKHHLETVDYPTGTVQVTLDAAGVPQYDICQGVAYDNLPWTPAIEAIARDTVAVCWGTLAQRNAVSRDTIMRFLDAMPSDEGTLRVFDINLRQQWYSREIIEQSLQRCNILKLNDEELPVLVEMFSLGDDPCRELMSQYGIHTVILTMGIHGSCVYHSDGVSIMPTPQVQVADTVGAGDSFTGAFVASLLRGDTVQQAHITAVKISAYVCTQPGAMPPYPPK
ncbi:MAG: carbohydrate kinase [Muribaculaceae bacterium]|nr:carbohydrate kinase [Muribaculaceae bacterium]